MNCDKCLALISDFLDGTLTGESRVLVSNHLKSCVECTAVHQELDTILNAAHEERYNYAAVPNERALWLRVRNTIEADLERDARRALAGEAAGSPRRNKSFGLREESLWTKLLSKRWQLSLPQLAAAVMAIIITVSFVTALGLRGINSDGVESIAAAPVSSSQGTAEISGRTVVKFNPDDYVRQQQPKIEYWNQRVEQHKARWSPRMRAAFERNIKVIDQSVNDSLSELRHSPHDEVLEEMLNSALQNKVEILKEFSEL